MIKYKPWTKTKEDAWKTDWIETEEKNTETKQKNAENIEQAQTRLLTDSDPTDEKTNQLHSVHVNSDDSVIINRYFTFMRSKFAIEHVPRMVREKVKLSQIQLEDDEIEEELEIPRTRNLGNTMQFGR